MAAPGSRHSAIFFPNSKALRRSGRVGFLQQGGVPDLNIPQPLPALHVQCHDLYVTITRPPRATQEEEEEQGGGGRVLTKTNEVGLHFVMGS